MAPIAPLKIIVAPAAKAIAKIGSTMTYDDVPCIVDERNDSCPYLGHVPFFAPKLSSSLDQHNCYHNLHDCRSNPRSNLLTWKQPRF